MSSTASKEVLLQMIEVTRQLEKVFSDIHRLKDFSRGQFIDGALINLVLDIAAYKKLVDEKQWRTFKESRVDAPVLLNNELLKNDWKPLTATGTIKMLDSGLFNYINGIIDEADNEYIQELYRQNLAIQPFSIQDELSKILIELFEFNKNDNVLFVGDALVNLAFLSQSKSKSNSVVANYFKENLSVLRKLDITKLDVEQDVFPDIKLQKEKGEKFNKVIMMPPWGARAVSSIKEKYKSYEEYFLEEGMHLTEDTVAIVLPAGYLSKTASRDRALKQYLVDGGYLTAVMQFPRKVLGDTYLAPAIIVLSKRQKEERVTFIDFDNEIFIREKHRVRVTLKSGGDFVEKLKDCSSEKVCRKVSRGEIAKNNFNLISP